MNAIIQKKGKICWIPDCKERPAESSCSIIICEELRTARSQRLSDMYLERGGICVDTDVVVVEKEPLSKL